VVKKSLGFLPAAVSPAGESTRREQARVNPDKTSARLFRFRATSISTVPDHQTSAAAVRFEGLRAGVPTGRDEDG
jgi:hypothetical protein